MHKESQIVDNQELITAPIFALFLADKLPNFKPYNRDFKLSYTDSSYKLKGRYKYKDWYITFVVNIPIEDISGYTVNVFSENNSVYGNIIDNISNVYDHMHFISLKDWLCGNRTVNV